MWDCRFLIIPMGLVEEGGFASLCGTVWATSMHGTMLIGSIRAP